MRSGESIRTIFAKINAPNSQNQLFLCAGPHHQWKNQQYFAMCPHPKHIQEALQRLADLLPYAVWKCGASVKKLFLTLPHQQACLPGVHFSCVDDTAHAAILLLFFALPTHACASSHACPLCIFSVVAGQPACCQTWLWLRRLAKATLRLAENHNLSAGTHGFLPPHTMAQHGPGCVGYLAATITGTKLSTQAHEEVDSSINFRTRAAFAKRRQRSNGDKGHDQLSPNQPVPLAQHGHQSTLAQPSSPAQRNNFSTRQEGPSFLP